MTNSSDSLNWYVAYVRSCQERRLAAILTQEGVEYYLPVQKEKRRWSDRIKTVEKLVIPGMIFIHTTPEIRVELKKDILLITRFMTNGPYKPVVVPDSQMKEFSFVVEHSSEPVSISSDRFLPGDRVEVIYGPLKGLVTEVAEISGESFLAIRLEMLGTAIVRIDAGHIRKIESN